MRLNTRILNPVTIFLLVFIIGACSPEEPEVPLVVSFDNLLVQTSATSATLTVTIVKNKGTQGKRGFLFGESPGLTLSNSQRINAPGSLLTFNVSIADLQANKEYYALPYTEVDGVEFVGDEFKIQTSTPAYTSVAPLTAGRGQRVKIDGNFFTDDQDDVSIKIGGEPATILSYTSSSVEFLIPEDAAFGSSNILFEVAGYNLGITETISVSRWSILKDTPFTKPYGTDFSYSYVFNNKPSYGAHIFDPLKDDWIIDPAFGNSISGTLLYPIDFQVNGKGYAGIAQGSKSFYEFDPIAKSWKKLNDFPGTGHNFYYGVWTPNGNKGYYGLGYNVVAGVTTGLYEFWEYSPVGDQWAKLSDYPGQPISGGVAFSIHEYVFVGGGYTIGTPSVFTGEFFAYDTQNHYWIQVADFPVVPPGGLFERAFAVGERGYFFTQNKIWIYDFNSNSWSLSDEVIPGPVNRTSYEVFCDGTKFYFAAGFAEGNGGYLDDFYKWYPED